jgi:hypothetical protein
MEGLLVHRTSLSIKREFQMSGPKDYSPPPRYSMQVFDGKLNRIFQLQSRLQLLCAEVEGLHISDSQLAIHFDCDSDLQELQGQNTDALKLLLFDYKGTFGQDVFNRVSSEIDSKISKIQKQVDACESIKSRFAAKKADYEAYRSYLCFYKNSQISFYEFKGQVTNYLSNNLKARVPEIFNEAEQRIGSVKFEKQASPFTFGFSSKSELQKQSVIEHVGQKENEINHIRSDISDKVLNKLKTARVATRAPKIEIADDKAAMIEKIKALSRRSDDPGSKKAYTKNLERLMESESLKDIYFFKELHDSILETEKVRNLKVELTKMLTDLNEVSIHKAVESERQKAIKLCLNLLRLSSVTTNQVDAARQRFEQMLRNSSQCFEQEEIRQKEHLFLKSQLVLCLENLGYEVMEDLQVIDFEKESDFLLKIRDQENYLNLKFKEDGSMRYVFQIPEDPKALSTDQKNLKLHEMKVTCDEFQSVLVDLSKMGLKIDLRSEKPVEYESLLSVSMSKKDSLKEKSKKRQRQQVRNKYLAV